MLSTKLAWSKKTVEWIETITGRSVSVPFTWNRALKAFPAVRRVKTRKVIHVALAVRQV